MMEQKYGANVKAILALIFSIPGQKDLGIAGIVVGSVGVALAVSIVVIYIVMHGSAASDGVTGAWNAISRLG